MAGPAMKVIFPVLLYFAVFVGETRFLPPTVGVVLPGHPAEGKLREGDRVLAINGERITTFAELHRIVAGSPNKELSLKIFRDNEQMENVLGVPIRKVVIPVAAGRNLAVLTEAAVRNTILQLRGIDTMADFMARQQAAMDDS